MLWYLPPTYPQLHAKSLLGALVFDPLEAAASNCFRDYLFSVTTVTASMHNSIQMPPMCISCQLPDNNAYWMDLLSLASHWNMLSLLCLAFFHPLHCHVFTSIAKLVITLEYSTCKYKLVILLLALFFLFWNITCVYTSVSNHSLALSLLFRYYI